MQLEHPSVPRSCVIVSLTTLILLPAASPALATSISLNPVRDTVLFSESGSLSNGDGVFLFAGRIDGSPVRRSLLKFDWGSQIPSGSTINGVTLKLVQSTPGENANGTRLTRWHRVLADWGEGVGISNSNDRGGGGGAPAVAGDATWSHRFFNTTPWSTPGGQFNSTASAQLNVGLNGTYTWSSTAGLVFDVQGWLANPSSNFGWILIGVEGTSTTAKRFTSVNGPANDRPLLTIDFTPPPPPVQLGDADQNGAVQRRDLVAVLNGYGKAAEAVFTDGDFDDSLSVTLRDLAILQQHFGEPPMVGSPAAVPEPSGAILASLGMIVGGFAWAVRRRRLL